MQKSIVFGANGYLGRHLVHFLNQHNHQVLSTGSNHQSIDNHQNYIQADTTNQTDIENINFDVDYIFVFVGLTGTSAGFDQYRQFTETNEISLLNILIHHRKSNSKARIVFPSSRLVYKGLTDVFLEEEAEKEALTVYAQNKLSCENYLRMYAHNFNINHTIFRICVPYGNTLSNDYSYGTIGFFLNKAKKKENITLYGEGNVKRTFTHVEDICESIIKTLSSPKSVNNTYNIGSKDNLSLLETAKLIADKYDIGIDFIKWPESALKIESGDTLFSDKKILNDTNYQYKHTLKNWINQLTI